MNSKHKLSLMNINVQLPFVPTINLVRFLPSKDVVPEGSVLKAVWSTRPSHLSHLFSFTSPSTKSECPCKYWQPGNIDYPTWIYKIKS